MAQAQAQAPDCASGRAAPWSDGAASSGLPRLLPLALGVVAALGTLWLWQRAQAEPGSAIGTAGGEQAGPPAVPVRSVPSVDLNRYQGTWYEVARLPMAFQAGCADQPTASYRLEGERVAVLNRCSGAKGEAREALGVAKVVPNSGNAQLKLSFAPAWLRWLPMVWADYWVLALDAEYQVALVGTPSREYLWVLARQPQISQGALQALTRRAKAMGFPTHRLQYAGAAH
ncbi:MAG TPA: lipocalin family protein [Ideonella sp.]|uniref:lipocalin family protein n=1 Tax=Ideonella sp. TaxID=1929293 RepID=UPI002CE5FE3F|nr:lipocalin family protein [Ideonella sp.]HSI49856.1 lipocalin family protein [Ideonella sp.]